MLQVQVGQTDDGGSDTIFTRVSFISSTSGKRLTFRNHHNVSCSDQVEVSFSLVKGNRNSAAQNDEELRKENTFLYNDFV